MTVLLTILEIFAYIFIFYYLLGCNVTFQKLRLISALFLFTAWICLQSQLSIAFPNTVTILFLIYLIFDCSIGFKTTWVILCTSIEALFVYLIYNSIYLIAYYFFQGNNIFEGHYNWFDFAFFCALLIISPFLRNSRQNRAEIIHKMSSRFNLLLSIIGICIFFLLNTAGLLFAGLSKKNILHLLGASAIILVFFALYTVSLLLKIQLKNIRLRELTFANEQALALEKEQYQLMQKKNQALRAFRHDFNGHVLALQTYARQNEAEKLYSYIDNLSAIQTTFKIYATENIIVDAILNQVAETLEDDVTFKVSGQFPPECFMDDMDLCILFTNMLNNATEAIHLLPPDEAKEIYVEIQGDQQEIQISVANTSSPYSQEELVHMTTRKSDRENHGFGLSNIHQISQKYHGDVIVDYQSGFFTICISCKYLY